MTCAECIIDIDVTQLGEGLTGERDDKSGKWDGKGEREVRKGGKRKGGGQKGRKQRGKEEGKGNRSRREKGEENGEEKGGVGRGKERAKGKGIKEKRGGKKKKMSHRNALIASGSALTTFPLSSSPFPSSSKWKRRFSNRTTSPAMTSARCRQSQMDKEKCIFHNRMTHAIATQWQ